MTDPAPVAATPIVVHAEPTQPQLEAGIRQLLLAIIPLATMFGMTKAAGILNAALGAAGAIATIGVFVYGQLVTRRHAVQAASMADKLPDTVAVAK